jgi:hypothetical protein
MWLLIRDLRGTLPLPTVVVWWKELYCYCSSNYYSTWKSVSGIATNATCFGEADGSIAVTNSRATVVITNANEVVANTGLVAGTYT